MKQVIFTKIGTKTEMPYLFAYQDNVWVFQFFGDKTYIDPFDGSTWTWENIDNSVDEVLAVVDGIIFLLQTDNVADCITQDNSFFWDDTNGYLYVHWSDERGDWAVSRSETFYSAIEGGYANGYIKESGNVYDAVYYAPKISNISGLSKQVDLTKFGLVSFSDSSFTFTDQKNNLDNVPSTEIIGVPIQFYLATPEDTNLTDDLRVFTGYLNGLKHNRKEANYNIIETRFFLNNPVCPNSVSSTVYSDCGDIEGEIIPTAWGKIRRGILIPVNNDVLETDVEDSAILLCADPAVGELLAIIKVYDQSGNELTIESTDLTACTVTVTKPVGFSPSDLKDCTWEGQGYDILGTYNNGLDIIKAAFLLLADISYIDSTFDRTTWNNETARNTESVGISTQSDKGFIEEIIEPITTSLQGVVEILGDGRISFASRNIVTKRDIDIKTIYKETQIEIPEIEIDPNEVVSELFIEYSRNFQTDEPLTLLHQSDRTYVVRNYSINRREPLSPVKTVLTESSDVESLAAQIMETSADPVRRISSEYTELFIDTRLFEIIGIETSLFDETSVIEYGELLSIEPDYNVNTQKITIRAIPGYQPSRYIQGHAFGPWGFNFIGYGATRYE